MYIYMYGCNFTVYIIYIYIHISCYFNACILGLGLSARLISETKTFKNKVVELFYLLYPYGRVVKKRKICLSFLVPADPCPESLGTNPLLPCLLKKISIFAGLRCKGPHPSFPQSQVAPLQGHTHSHCG